MKKLVIALLILLTTSACSDSGIQRIQKVRGKAQCALEVYCTVTKNLKITKKIARTIIQTQVPGKLKDICKTYNSIRDLDYRRSVAKRCKK